MATQPRQLTEIPTNAIVVKKESFTTKGVEYKVWFDPLTLKFGCTCPHFENRVGPRNEEEQRMDTCKHLDDTKLIEVIEAIMERKTHMENEHGLGTKGK